jgi:hypothetical protein
MSTMMDVLQTCGVSAADSANYCARVIKDKPMKATQFGDHYKPTFFEVYGQGNIVQASHECRRNLNVDGLRAFDLRTFKPNGEAWEFHKASDRQEARQHVEEEKRRWIIGCPPCTFFPLWNQGMNHKKMDPERVEVPRKEAVQHLHFVMGLYKLQLENGRHFLHEHPATASSWADPLMERLMKQRGVLQWCQTNANMDFSLQDLNVNQCRRRNPLDGCHLHHICSRDYLDDVKEIINTNI